jgi:hypothetical protein
LTSIEFGNEHQLLEQTANGILVHLKEAQCLFADRTIADATETSLTNINRLIEAECALTYRTLVIAYKLMDEKSFSIEEAETELILLAVLSIGVSLRGE